MVARAKKYFKHLELIREDIREEFDLLGVPSNLSRICDYGCGNGLTTFGLALESQGAECVGVDLFDEPTKPTPEKLSQYVGAVEDECNHTAPNNAFPGNVCGLIKERRLPQFIRGNIVLNHNLPQNIDLAYCKKVLTNLLGKESEGTPSGEVGLRLGLKNITQNLTAGGFLCVVEYDKDFGLGNYLESSQLNILKRTQIKRREIRLRGRTKVVSTFSLYLCQRT